MKDPIVKIEKQTSDYVQQIKDIFTSKQQEGELPSYAEFVDKLMKPMDTVALNLHHAATGMSGESGEVIDITKKVWIQNKPLDVDHLIKELGDMRFYYQAMINFLGLTDQDIVTQNMAKLYKRFGEAGEYSDAAAQAQVDKNGESRG